MINKTFVLCIYFLESYLAFREDNIKNKKIRA